MARHAKPPRMERESSGWYYVRWHDGQRSRRESLETKDLEEAKTHFSQWLIIDTLPANHDYTIDELFGLYDDEHLGTVADPSRARQRLGFLRQHFGNLTPDMIRPNVVMDYLKKRPVTSSTVRGELAILKAALNHNVKAGRIDSFPHIQLPPKGEPRDRWLTTVEVHELFNNAEARRQADRLSRVERFIWIALEAAARKRTIEQLTWDRVDLERGTIDFRVPGKAATKKRQARVPVSDRLAPVLERAYNEKKGNYVLDHSGSIRTAFENLAITSGMTGVTPHVLRHTAATHMAQRGVSLWQIAGILGNSVQMVEETYAHQCPDNLRQAVNYGRTDKRIS